MRYYSISAERQGKPVRLGATSAAEALRAVFSLRRDGWSAIVIRRGTERISLDDLKGDADLERARAH